MRPELEALLANPSSDLPPIDNKPGKTLNRLLADGVLDRTGAQQLPFATETDSRESSTEASKSR